MVGLRAHALTRDNALIDYVRHYLAFIERAQRPDGRFRNFAGADGEWLEEVGSDDSQGRSVWALAFAAATSKQTEVRVRALKCLDQALPRLGDLASLRSRAFVLIAARYWREVEPNAQLDKLDQQFTAALTTAYESNRAAGWLWFEGQLTYSNAQLCQALLAGSAAYIGLETLAWLCQQMETDDGLISLIGSNGFYTRGGPRAVYDQQAVDAEATLSTCLMAWQLSGDERFRRWAEMSYGWFLGRNVGKQPMVDPETGGCFDGLTPTGVNTNQGAESLLAWLMAEEDMMEAGLI